MGRRRSPIVRTVLSTLKDAGIEPVVREGSKHVVVEFRGADGVRRLITVSRSPSHRNSELAALGDAKRAIRQAGASARVEA
jgi:hypothetical protein